MTANAHTDITPGAPANAGVVNAPLGQLDASLTQRGFNVKDVAYGAIGNGVADDTAAITAAEAAAVAAGPGAKVIFPPGTYLATTLTKQSLTFWEGSGMDATIIKLKNGTNADLIQGASFGTLTNTGNREGIHHWGIRHMTLNGNKANQSGTSYGLRVYAHSYVIENVKINDCLTDGIWSEWANSVSLPASNEEDVWAILTNVHVYRSGQNGIHWLGPHDSTWTFVWAGKCLNYGFWVDTNANSSGSGLKAINSHAFANTLNAWRVYTQISMVNCKGESSSAFSGAGIPMVYFGGSSGSANESSIIGGQYGTFSGGHNDYAFEFSQPITDLHLITQIENVVLGAIKLDTGADIGGNFFRINAYLPDGGAVMFATNQPNAGSFVEAHATGANGASLFQFPAAVSIASGLALQLYRANNASFASVSFDGVWINTTWPLQTAASQALKAGGALIAAKDFQRSRQTPTEAVLVSGVDATAGELIGVTLTAARLVGVPLNPVIGQRLGFTLIQSGAGAFAVTWNAVFKGITGGTSGATGTRATFSFNYDGTNWNLDGAQPTWV